MPTVTLSSAENPSEAQRIRGGSKIYAFHGDFDGGTVTMEASYDGGVNWITVNEDVNGTTFEVTTEGIYEINLGNCLVRFTATGLDSDSNPLDVTVTIS